MKKQKGSPCGEAGQTLLEILLAFSVSILVLSAIVIGITTSLSNTQYTRNQNSANSYAQEGMAVVRQIKNSSWSSFLLKGQKNYCLAENSTELVVRTSANCEQNVGIFSREVTIEHGYTSGNSSGDSSCSPGNPPMPTPTPTPPVTPEWSKITVKVSWSDNKCPLGTPLCHKVELITCLSNADQKQSP